VTRLSKAEVLTAKSSSDNDARGSEPHFHYCGLLVSAANSEEWNLASQEGVPWIDLKDPARGALGKPNLELATAFAASMRNQNQPRWSIAGGELSEWDCDSDQAYCRILGSTGHIKWALAGCEGRFPWQEQLGRSIAYLAFPQQAILVHYADHLECQAPDWESVLSAAHRMGTRYVLIDTGLKNGRGLLDHLSPTRLRQQVTQANRLGLEVAIAGALGLEQIPLGQSIGAAWVGVRGAVCSDAGRTSPFCQEKLQQAVAIVRGSATTDERRETHHVIG
jgi:uncharacterized protein (UPF0264 family)